MVKNRENNGMEEIVLVALTLEMPWDPFSQLEYQCCLFSENECKILNS